MDFSSVQNINIVVKQVQNVFYLAEPNSVPIKEPPPPAPRNYLSAFYFHEFDHFMSLIWVKSCGVCPFMTGSFCSA